MSDLRDQIAEAIREAIRQAPKRPALGYGGVTEVGISMRDLADAVMHVIEPALLAEQVAATERADTLAARLQQAEAERGTAREALDAAGIVIASLRAQRDEQRQRAEHAEDRIRQIAASVEQSRARADDAEAARDRWRRRAEKAEAAVERVRKLATEAIEGWEPERDYNQDRADRKGYSTNETAAEIYGDAIGALTDILAATAQQDGRSAEETP